MIKPNMGVEMGEPANVIYGKMGTIGLIAVALWSLGSCSKSVVNTKIVSKWELGLLKQIKMMSHGQLHVIHHKKRMWYYLTEFQIYFWWNGSCFPWCNSIFYKGIWFWNLVRGYLAVTQTLQRFPSLLVISHSPTESGEWFPWISTCCWKLCLKSDIEKEFKVQMNYSLCMIHRAGAICNFTGYFSWNMLGLLTPSYTNGLKHYWKLLCISLDVSWFHFIHR